jgi:hypothetical protein
VSVLPEPVDFRDVLRGHLQALEAADEVCRAAADARRAVLKAAASDGLNTGLLKLVLREHNLSDEVREELEDYRNACRDWQRTPLGATAVATTDTMR